MGLYSKSLKRVLALSLLLSLPAVAMGPPRVISTDAAATALLLALGADEALVGVDVTSQLPEGYRELPNVGYHRALSAEGLLALNPTLVLGSEHLGPPTVLRALSGAGVTVEQMTTATSVDELQANVQRVAALMQREAQGQQLVARLEQQRQTLQNSPLSGQRAVFLLAVSGGKLRMAGNDTAGASFLELLQMDNVAGYLGYRTVTAEALLALDPDVIVVAVDEGAGAEKLLQASPLLRHGRAGREQRILAVDASTLVAGLSAGALTAAVTLIESGAAQ